MYPNCVHWVDHFYLVPLMGRSSISCFGLTISVRDSQFSMMSVIKIVSLACLYFVLNIVFHHQEPLYLDAVRAAMSRAGKCHDECTRLSEPDSWYTSTALSGWYGSHRDACYTPSEGVLKSEGNHIGTVISILYMAVEPGTFFHELQIAHFLAKMVNSFQKR